METNTVIFIFWVKLIFNRGWLVKESKCNKWEDLKEKYPLTLKKSLILKQLSLLIGVHLFNKLIIYC